MAGIINLRRIFMKHLMIIIALICFSVIGAFSIDNAVHNFFKSNWFWFGMWIMGAVIQVAFIFKNILR